MDDSIPRSIFLLAAYILTAGVFAGAETAFSYTNGVRMKLYAESGDKGARRVNYILERFERTVVTLLIAINVIHILAASTAAVLAFSVLGSVGGVVSTVALAILVFLFAENIPKNIARANPEPFAKAVSLPVYGLIHLLWPFSSFFMGIAAGVKRLTGLRPDAPAITEDEFAEIVESVGDDGLIEPEETEIIKSAIEFGDQKVAEVMMPRGLISAIPINVSEEKLKNILLSEKYSRFPVYDGNIDHIVGVLQSASCLWKLVKGKTFQMKGSLAKPYYVSPETLLCEVFAEMGKKRTHFAIVRSAKGKTAGIITMEDILEEIVGEIYDEDDDSSPEDTKRGKT